IDPGTLFEGHDEAWGNAQFEDFVAHHYHQPSDEFQESWDFGGNAKLARFGFVLGWLASAQPHSIEWHQGDEFETPRKKSETTAASDGEQRESGRYRTFYREVSRSVSLLRREANSGPDLIEVRHTAMWV